MNPLSLIDGKTALPSPQARRSSADTDPVVIDQTSVGEVNRSRYGRRAFLRLGATLAGAAATGAIVAKTLQTPGPNPEGPALKPWANAKRYHVAIVGGGVSGIYAGWRLRGCDGSAPPPGMLDHPDVAVFEKSIHISGRVRSVKMPNTDQYAELGAMRYVPSQHPLVRALVEDKLRLPTREFHVTGDNNLSYFRGKRMTSKEISANPSILPYNLRDDEKGKTPAQLLEGAILKIAPNVERFGDLDWQKFRETGTMQLRDTHSGAAKEVSLHDVGFRNALARNMSQEAFTLVKDAFGYDTIMENWNTIQAVHEMAEDFRPDTTYRTLQNGMMEIPNTLRAQFEARGGKVELQHVLQSVDYDNDMKCFVLQFDSGGEKEWVLADKAILAMPARPLKQIVQNSPLLQTEELRNNLEAVRPNPMTRIISTYKKPWWEEKGIEKGRSVTDLPVRQLYYYGGKNGSDSFTMAYADGGGDEFWAGYQQPQEPDSPKKLDASEPLVAEMRAQVSEMHDQEVPKPEHVMYKRWASETYGGAYHNYNAGFKAHEVAAAMLAPLHNLPLYICGEAFSLHQGWIEGALQTAEQVVRLIGKSGLSSGLVNIPVSRSPQLSCMSCHTR